jgi:hypothetical protein
MTAALEYVYLRLPTRDDPSLRKAVADAITAAANDGKTSLVEFQEAGLKVINNKRPPKRSWLSNLFR